MTIIDIPYFFGMNTPLYEEQVKAIYTYDFLKDKCQPLNLKNYNEFSKYLIDASTSYLSAKEMNADRVTPREQKIIFKNFESSLKETLKHYLKVQQYGSTSANYHDALRDLVSKTEEAGMQEMFSPYVTLGDGKENLGGISITLFEKFLGVLIEASSNAPRHIKPYQKANISNDYILWWINRLGKYWTEFTDITFGLGDWYTNEQLGSSAVKGKKGRYISTSLDVLYDLLHAVDNKITHSDIETAMRKYKKI